MFFFADPQKYKDLGEKLEFERILKENEINSNVATDTMDILSDISQESQDSMSSSLINKPSTSCQQKFKWTSESIKLLLDIRFSMQDQFEKPKCKISKLWIQVSNKMLDIGKYNVKWDDCHGKYRNLLQTYKHNKEKRLKKSGESTITWEYFELFDTALGHKASTCPPMNILSTSLPRNENISSNKSTDIGSEGEVESENENVEATPKRIKTAAATPSSSTGSFLSRKHDKKISLPEYLYLKNQREKEIWEDKKRFKEREIDAINNLAAAIRESGTRTTPSEIDS